MKSSRIVRNCVGSYAIELAAWGYSELGVNVNSPLWLIGFLLMLVPIELHPVFCYIEDGCEVHPGVINAARMDRKS